MIFSFFEIMRRLKREKKIQLQHKKKSYDAFERIKIREIKREFIILFSY